MNLYQIMTNHYAPKGSHKAIWLYLLANDSESVYKWLKSEPTIKDDLGSLYLCWSDWEKEDEDYGNFAEQMISAEDEEGTDRANYDDLFYGRTFVSWERIYGDVSEYMASVLEKSGIRIFRVE